MSVSTACWVMSSSICSMSSGRGSWSRRFRDSWAEEIQSSSLCTSSRSASAVARPAWILSPCCWAHDWTWDREWTNSLRPSLFILQCFTRYHLLSVTMTFTWTWLELKWNHICVWDEINKLAFSISFFLSLALQVSIPSALLIWWNTPQLHHCTDCEFLCAHLLKTGLSDADPRLDGDDRVSVAGGQDLLTQGTDAL